MALPERTFHRRIIEVSKDEVHMESGDELLRRCCRSSLGGAIDNIELEAPLSDTKWTSYSTDVSLFTCSAINRYQS